MEEKDIIRSIKSHYRSGNDDLVRDFFSPCIANCLYYQRASGFFSSTALITWANILPKLANSQDVHIQLIISPRLSTADRKALILIADETSRVAFLQKVSDQIVLEALSFTDDPKNYGLRLKLFSWMVASGRLELRFAFPTHTDNPGIFHEKIGVFTFPWGDQIAFTGSANESQMGHSKNYETVDVYRSWVREDMDRVFIKSEQFLEAWENNADGLECVRLSHSALEKVKEIAPEKYPLNTQSPARNTIKWKHQDKALECFLAVEQGILEMATGTGKTRTSLRIVKKLLEREEILTIVVSADGIDLLNQWYNELLHFFNDINVQFPIMRHYGKYKERDKFILTPRHSVFLSSRPALAPALRTLRIDDAQKTLLIHDEVHKLGSQANRLALQDLSNNVRFRLGLSATPEREYDDEGNDFVSNHIGPVIFQFDLSEAIRRRILCPFRYHALEYSPSQEDRERISQVYKKAAARKHAGDPMSQEEIWIDLARVYKTSRTKLPIFNEFIASREHLLKRCIVFVETMEYGQDVLEILHKYRTDFHSYFSGEDGITLRRFAAGDLECLLTCHRLSEGIDIQSLKSVILFSSARSRLETIQRIGRCLRSDPNNPEKIADIIDFIRIDDEKDEGQHIVNADHERRVWLTELASIRP